MVCPCVFIYYSCAVIYALVLCGLHQMMAVILCCGHLKSIHILVANKIPFKVFTLKGWFPNVKGTGDGLFSHVIITYLTVLMLADITTHVSSGCISPPNLLQNSPHFILCTSACFSTDHYNQMGFVCWLHTGPVGIVQWAHIMSITRTVWMNYQIFEMGKLKPFWDASLLTNEVKYDRWVPPCWQIKCNYDKWVHLVDSYINIDI